MWEPAVPILVHHNVRILKAVAADNVLQLLPSERGFPHQNGGRLAHEPGTSHGLPPPPKKKALHSSSSYLNRTRQAHLVVKGRLPKNTLGPAGPPSPALPPPLPLPLPPPLPLPLPFPLHGMLWDAVPVSYSHTQRGGDMHSELAKTDPTPSHTTPRGRYHRPPPVAWIALWLIGAAAPNVFADEALSIPATACHTSQCPARETPAAFSLTTLDPPVPCPPSRAPRTGAPGEEEGA